MTRPAVAAIVLALLLPLAVAAVPNFASVDVQTYESPKPAPGFSLSDLDGHPVRLSDLRGKVVLLYYWATW